MSSNNNNIFQRIVLVIAISLSLSAAAQDITAVQDSIAAQDSINPADTVASSSRIYEFMKPWIFSGYRNLAHPHKYTIFPDKALMSKAWKDSVTTIHDIDSIPVSNHEPDLMSNPMPDWLRKSIDRQRMIDDCIYQSMVTHPELIDYAYWELPQPPKIPEEDYSFRGFLNRMHIPGLQIDDSLKVATEEEERTNWLHTFNIALQLSQAFVSSNWYQGGNSYLAFLGNFLWDVELNNVYHPKFIFKSSLSYKLAANSTPDDLYHKYSISQDLFQYNLRMGYKAAKYWYYSFTTQFKTQFLNNYPANSPDRSASFLSPGELNIGLGMTYSKESANKNLAFAATISPISYNLKTCIDPKIDHSTFGIKPDRKYANEFGSNAEVNFKAYFLNFATYTTRLFLFTDYKSFQADWENTLNLQFTKLFSTQIYAHMRYDTHIDSSISRKWRKLMLKEILSVGISYTFSTK